MYRPLTLELLSFLQDSKVFHLYRMYMYYHLDCFAAIIAFIAVLSSFLSRNYNSYGKLYFYCKNFDCKYYRSA
jgi:hypothetical protein